MTEQEYMSDMFCKLAFISFQRSLESDGLVDMLGVGDILNKTNNESDARKLLRGKQSGPPKMPGKEHLFEPGFAPKPSTTQRMADIARSAKKEVKHVGSRLFRDLVHGGPKVDVSNYPGMFASNRGTLKNIGRAAAPGAAVGAMLAGGVSAHRGEDASDVASSSARGALMGGALGTLLPHGAGGAARSPIRHTAARLGNRLMAAGTIAGGIHSLTRSRDEGEGFFESMGRRAGNLATGASFFANPAGRLHRTGMNIMNLQFGGLIAGEAAKATGHGRVGEAMSSIPGFGDIGAAAGKGLDVLSAGTRKVLGGGKSYSQTKREALGPPLNQPKPQSLDGQQYRMEPEYK
jgi:hypothetical protein